ncbi:CRISPR system precrRNA processing endoribonuclease RAMP protein Cas6 [Cuneatibacter sp. NSJ-177]|uniref:CRISPR system precrRNA processing endoribonuclease RAMP protein Cas6 n=1 Tax=Cuneatibacter sp. NSJ-177 TaxID=2931401 RepID=UPI001FD2E936|nr:CRISPR system precrRNA processing endoribonuclease RAMP protein Cas6 [Cuneatibacter sp. NSJ-177]MCJ7837416.1 CRISPR system precrRNA processing endoribonuclease RAMP protein Cas6 [Cuneatibacter sp. NSJ-177]
MQNESSALFSLSYLPLLIRLRCCETARLPAFLGSTLHGAVGWALQSNRAVYQYLYENGKSRGDGRDVGNPYLLEPPLENRTVYQEGEELRFRFVLLGDAVQYAPEFIKALAKTKELRLGVGRKKFELMEIMQAGRLESLWKKEAEDCVSKIEIENLADEPPVICRNFAMLLKTPLRIRREGKLLTTLDFPTVIRNITKRIQSLTERYGGEIDLEESGHLCLLAERIQMTSCEMSVKQLERYSNRRGEKMDFSGILGSMTCEGDLTPFTPWLGAAQVLHIGRNVTFGFGKVDLVFW